MLGIFLIPLLYLTIRRIGRKHDDPDEASARSSDLPRDGEPAQ
ncbi:MAG: hypothetical protein R3E03_00680 [Novosphingobium sp.]